MRTVASGLSHASILGGGLPSLPLELAGRAGIIVDTRNEEEAMLPRRDRPPEGQLEHGPAGPVASTGIWGDVPSTLGPGAWTISFRLWYGSDAIVYEPVPGGTPRYQEEDPFTAACSTHIDTVGVLSVTLHVAFLGSACTVETQLAR